MKVKTSLNLGMSTMIQNHCFCVTEDSEVGCPLLNICPQTPYMQILHECVNKTSSLFSTILQVDDKFDIKDKTMPLKTLSLKILSSVFVRNKLLK